jgi:hypothetical protein
MLKALPVFIAGVTLGAVGVVMFSGTARPASPPPGPPPTTLSCGSSEPATAARVAQLEDEVRMLREERKPQPVSIASAATPEPVASGVEEPEGKREQEEALQWKISAIEKFVPLSATEKERLRKKYIAERDARANGQDPQTESLDEILGVENARYYREQVNAAFKRMQDAEVEKEVLLVSRQLSLSPEQEEGIRSVFVSVEKTIQEEGGQRQEGTAHERVKTMVEENKRRDALRREELQKILRPEQYERYLAMQAESPASDVEVFHDSGQ